MHSSKYLPTLVMKEVAVAFKIQEEWKELLPEGIIPIVATLRHVEQLPLLT